MEISLLPGSIVLENIGIQPSNLLQQVPPQQLDHYIAVINWLTDYQININASHRQKLEGYLQALYHLCDAQAWKRASDILSMSLTPPGQQQFHQQLGIWGCYSELIQLYKHLLGNLEPVTELAYLCGLGNVYYSISKYSECFQCYQKGLEIAIELDDKSMQSQLLNNLGSVYLMQSNYDTAIDFYEQGLTIAHELKNRHLENILNTRLGLAYIYLGQYSKALECYQNELVNVREIGDPEQESIVLTNLGLVYICMEDYVKALDYNKQGLEVAQKIGYRTQEAWGTCNIGKTLMRMNQYQEAEQNLQLALSIFREMECRRAESEVLEALSELYQNMNLDHLSAQCYAQALVITQELGVTIINPTSTKLAVPKVDGL
ncbi:tetratricopeptide repeat protein [Cuspidothrix issatschenkoi]|uniref:tetratricopeptide repeat protein n=1 Tax=Cuspidothrix issatschenkoi TaxID=230752 RepID=UPI001D134B56|nr:tetratricopeptide repeat protein [Cuspidothrix issatschenkoi]